MFVILPSPDFTEEATGAQGVALTGLKSIRGQIWTNSSAMRAPLMVSPANQKAGQEFLKAASPNLGELTAFCGGRTPSASKAKPDLMVGLCLSSSLVKTSKRPLKPRRRETCRRPT